jgi:hypothetical protein
MKKRCYEHDSDRVCWQIGDLLAASERDSGFRSGARFVIDLALADHIGEFDTSSYTGPGRTYNAEESRHYLSRSFYFIAWRWGVSVQWRGRRITRDGWALPEEEEMEA